MSPPSKRMKPESPWDTLTSILPWNWFKIKEQQPVDSPSDSGSEKDEQTDYSITRKLEAVKVNATHPFMVTPISKPSQHIVFDESRVVPSRPDSRTTNTISSPKSIASSLLHKKKHGFSSIRKQQSRQQESIAKNMKSKFVPGFQAIKSKGTPGDYDSLVAYMKQVKEYQKEHNEKSPEIKPKPLPKQLEEDNQAQTKELEWIKDLRKKIDDIINKPIEPIPKPDEKKDSIYKKLTEKDEEISRKIEALKSYKKKDLFPPLPPDEIAKVKKSMNAPESTLLIQKFNIPIHSRDLRTLSGSSWLNDEVINYYAELIMERANNEPDRYPKVHVFNTFFYPALSSRGYQGVRRWSKKFDVFAKDYIIIPVHLGMHWCCSVIDIKRKRFLYYDSLHGGNSKCLRLLREYIEQESLDKKKVELDTSDWTAAAPNVPNTNQDIPAQENGFDCGVFTCMFMEFTAREESFEFRQKHMPYIRTRIASEILNAKLMCY